jgi:hypothetical protein
VTIPYVGRCLGSGKPPLEGTEMPYRGGTTGLCVACSGRFPIENGTITDHETAEADERESLREEALPGGAPPSRTENDAGPSPEEEMRGAQPPNADRLIGSVGEHEVRRTGKTGEVVDLDEVTETDSGRSARWSHDP